MSAKLSKNQKESILQEFREPRDHKGKIPYILFGFIGKDYNTGDKGKNTPKVRTFCLDISGCHKEVSNIVQYTTIKKYEVLKYYIPDRPQDPEKEDKYQEIRSHIEGGKGDPREIQARDQRINQLEQELEEMKRKELEEIQEQEGNDGKENENSGEVQSDGETTALGTPTA